MSEGKEEYAQAEENLPLVLADKLLKGGEGFEEGKQDLSRGREKLSLARKVRAACAIGAGVFATLLIGLGLYWRQTLTRSFTREDA